MSMSSAQLQELRHAADEEEKASEIRSVLVSQGMEHLLAGEPKNSSIECMHLQAYIQYGADGQSDNLRSSSLILSKSDAPCRYYTMPGGCVRGEKCLYSHPNAEIMSMEMGQSFMPKLLVGGTKRVGAEDLRKKIFVGGLLPSVESEDLREFFELNYGPVVDAVVIGSQAGDQMQSRGFGFVTFKHAASVSAAVEAHYINIYGKKVEIKGAVPRSEMPALEVSRADSDSPIDPQAAMSANKALDLNEADVLEVSTPGSLSLPKEEPSQCNQSSVMAEPQQLSPSECAPSSLSGLPSSRASNVSSDSIGKPVIREPSAESASSTSHGLPAANVSGVSGDPYSQSVMRGGSSGYVQEAKPAWLNTFKEWLPEFLTRVSMRLKEGEWYPLSSLKGDYRAICGLELDHVSIGFEKLSDFVRSFPELCRMKIVPVGRGPATHMVLLPPNSRTKPLAAPRRNLSNITTRSLVDGTRSYAEVAGHGSAARFGRTDTTPSSHPAFCSGGTSLVRQGAHTGVLPTSSEERPYPTDRQPPIPFGLCQRNFPSRENGTGGAPYAAAAGYNAGLISTSNGPLRTSMTRAEGQSRSDSSNGSTVTSNSSSSDRVGRSGNHATVVHAADTETMSAGEISSNSDVNPGLSEEDLGLLQELISRLKKTGIDQHVPTPYHTAAGSQPALAKMHAALSSRQAPPGYQKPLQNVDNERERSLKYFPFFDQEPKTALLENIPLTTPFNHPFAGFLPENFPPNSSMWGQDANSNRIKEGGYGIQGRAVENINPAGLFYEDSPDSNKSIYSTPRGYLSSSSSPGQGYLKMAGTCEICFERQAVWVAVPCGHKNMCSVCKGGLRQDTAQCFICNGYVERWIAIH